MISQQPTKSSCRGLISRTWVVPTISVPVWSNRAVLASPGVSIAPAPLTITPARAARDKSVMA
jgi:hypothetical protein